MSKRANGEGTIYKSESKKCWVGQISFINEETGKTQRKTVYGKTQKIVREKLANLKSDSGITEKPQDVTVVSLMKKTIDHEKEINILKDVSYLRKMETLKILEKYALSNKPIQEIEKADILYLLTNITAYSNSVISKVYTMLNNAFKQAVVQNIITSNPLDDKFTFKKPKSNKPTKRVSALTIDEQKQFIDILKTNSHILYKEQMLLSLLTGARMGEINALMYEDIDFKEKTVHINRTVTKNELDIAIIGESTKTYAGNRVLHLHDDVFKIIEKYIEEKEITTGLLFVSKSNKIISTNSVNSEFKRVCEKYNINKGFGVNQHMLRHTFATRCIESGMPAPVLQKILGHTDISTTINTYTDVFAEYERKHVDNSFDYLKSLNFNI